ncbi:MAG: hypothetical protein N2255_04005 [Kiritimatiellae bacterium]|nr:hypothetical protein [Kiritimatiellia bacterium]
MRVWKFFVGLALLPCCVAVTRTFFRLLASLQPPLDAGTIPAGAWAIFAGAILWCALFFMFPRPLRLYVLGHELTHALWGVLMGAKVSRLRVRSDKGSVTLSKTNWFITLAPYFFPFYTALVIVAYLVLSLFLPASRYYLFWLGLVGFTWAFHLTFTVYALLQHQPDIRENGIVFSYAMIYVMNLLGMGLWVVAVSSATIRDWAYFLATDTKETWLSCWAGLERFALLVCNKADG